MVFVLSHEDCVCVRSCVWYLLVMRTVFVSGHVYGICVKS